jgi:transcriptional antiterminator RfaH
LFPGYVFCRFDASYAYPVLNSPGVVHIVSAGNRPIPVDDREMEAVRAICAADLPALPWSQLAVGQRMVVVRGPLKGTEGMIVRIKDSYRLVASISLLNRGVSIELDHTWIAPVC